MSLPPFQTLLDQHAPALHRHMWALVGPDDADDATQEVLIAALRAYPRLRHDENLRGWLWTIARHVAIDRHRRSRRRPQTTPLDGSEASPASPGGSDPPTADGSDPDAADLWAAVRRLPEGQRVAVALRFADDLTYRDIALLVGCSEGAARQRVHEGLTTLRREMREMDEVST